MNDAIADDDPSMGGEPEEIKQGYIRGESDALNNIHQRFEDPSYSDFSRGYCQGYLFVKNCLGD